MVVDAETAQKYCDKLVQLVTAAKVDVERARVLYADQVRNTALLRAMQGRLEAWVVRLDKQEKLVETYKGRSIDISIYISPSEDIKMDLNEHITLCVEAVREALVAIAQPVVNHGVRIVKTTASEFPKFDGVIDFEIWETNWKNLANNSGHGVAGLLIKLRESLVDRAKEYIGVSGMANLTYNQT